MAASKTASQAAARSIAEVIQAEEAARKVFETTTFHGPYTIAQLREAFEAVQNPQGWKLPIQVHNFQAEKIAITTAAVIFYQGCRPTVTKYPDGTLYLASAGYCC